MIYHDGTICERCGFSRRAHREGRPPCSGFQAPRPRALGEAERAVSLEAVRAAMATATLAVRYRQNRETTREAFHWSRFCDALRDAESLGVPLSAMPAEIQALADLRAAR